LAIRVNDSKIALKSGFEKYLRIDKDDVIRGISDAVGSMEQWEPVFQVSFMFLFTIGQKKKMNMIFRKANQLFWVRITASCP